MSHILYFDFKSLNILFKFPWELSIATSAISVFYIQMQNNVISKDSKK